MALTISKKSLYNGMCEIRFSAERSESDAEQEAVWPPCDLHGCGGDQRREHRERFAKSTCDASPELGGDRLSLPLL